MTMTDEQFFAWLDGELDGEAAARVAALVAADPELAEQARAHRALGERLRGAFASVMAEPEAPAAVVDLKAARDKRAARRVGVPQWAAMAATLALGIGLGTVVGDRGGQAPVAIEGGRMVAAADLGEALDAQLASAGNQGATRIGLTFRNNNGAVCRSFENAAASGLACREGEAWKIEGLYGAEAAGGEYRMAAGGDPRLAALIDAEMAGEPLDAAGERAAQAKGWR